MHIRLPIFLEMEKIIFDLQYSWGSPWICIHTWAELCLIVVGTKFIAQENNFISLGSKFQVLAERTCLTSPRLEKENSKKPLPREVIPHFLMEFHSIASLEWSKTTMRRLGPLGQMIHPWRLSLEAFNHNWYSSYGVVIDKLSPFTHGFGSWINGKLHTLMTASLKDFVMVFCC